MTRRVEGISWMRALLDDEELGHLAMCDGYVPHVVPLNYAHIDDRIVINCSSGGRKVDMLRANPACCFAVNRHPDRVRHRADRRCHYRYHSVLVFG